MFNYRYQLSFRIGGCSTLAIYRGLVVGRYADILRVALGIKENKLACLFYRAFKS